MDLYMGKTKIAALAIQAFAKLDDELKQAAISMAEAALSAGDEQEQAMSASTLEEILFPAQSPIPAIEEKLSRIPFLDRLRWNEFSAPGDSVGAQLTGITKSEWLKWGKARGYKLSAWGNSLEFKGEPRPGDVKHADWFAVRLVKVPADKVLHVANAILAIKFAPFTRVESLAIAKASLDKPVVFIDSVFKEQAIDIKQAIEAAGGTVEIGPVTY